MGLGILDRTVLRPAPGTALLEDMGNTHHVESDNSTLKRSKDGIILIPQPSDDPNDPLNWPLWRRDIITFLLCILSVLASTLSPLLAANTITLLIWFGNRSITDMALLTGYHLLGVALAGFIFVATARVWGKRHSFIIGTVIIIISSIWGGFAGHNYDSLVAARFFQGVGLAPFEACINASVGDLYCVHERGKRMALTNLCLFGGAFFTPVIVGKSTNTLGWPWTFWLVAIFTAAILPVVYFFCPETTYVRDGKHAKHLTELSANIEMGSPSRSDMLDGGSVRDNENTPQPGSEVNPGAAVKRIENFSQVSLHLTNDSAPPPPSIPKPIPWVSKESLRLFNGRKTDESFIQLLLRPLPLFFHPAVLWAVLIQGTLIGWTALLGVILAYIMIQPPLGFDEVYTGYMYAGAFVGALVGFVLAGLITDPTTKWLAERNGGVFEPEFRLVLVIPQLIFGCAGLFGFGITSADTYTYGWFWPDFFFGCVTCGMVLGAVGSALYIVDAHADIEIEAFTCCLIFKNMFTFALTFEAFNWLQSSGIYTLMFASGGLQIGICALTIPMWVFGKKSRSFWTRNDMLKFLRLRR